MGICFTLTYRLYVSAFLYMRKTHQRDCPRYVASVFQAHYLIISRTYQRDEVREHDRQRNHFQNCYIFVVVAPVVAPYMSRWTSRWCVDSHVFVVASLLAYLIALAFALVCFVLYTLPCRKLNYKRPPINICVFI